MNSTVRFGEWETRDDLPPVRRLERRWHWPFAVEVLGRVTDRRVYETWRGPDGQRYGRWTWEREL